MTDHTLDPAFRSWVGEGLPVRRGDDTGSRGFPLQVLPYGVVSLPGDATPRLAVAIGDAVLDLAAAGAAGLLDELDEGVRLAVGAGRLNPLLALAPPDWTTLRHRLFALLVDDHSAWRGVRDTVRACLHPIDAVRSHLPFDVGDYTDFYASIHHATNVGTMLRPEQPLLPNYRHVPIGYHGRASSVVVSGTPVRRPWGQVVRPGTDAPVFAPSQRLDYELEVGIVIGGDNALGAPVPVSRAADRIFGIVLLDDWSARDVQAWEYQPLGPFLSKSFATTISAWVVPIEALAGRRVPAARRASGDPEPLPYLYDEADQQAGAIDLDLEVTLSSAAMRDAGQSPASVSRSNLRNLYWTPAQLVAHHTSNGCNLRPGDLLGTGTVSGPEPAMRGCLLERTWRGTEPFGLPSGENRRFLEDGDEVVLQSSIGLRCLGRVDPPVEWSRA